MDLLLIAVLGVLTVAGTTAFAPRVRIAAPLLLVVLGIAVSFLPFVPAVVINPEWILVGVLPPLLYSASVAMPVTNFRREFGAIRGLAVVLVVISSLVVGAFFAWAIPDLGLWWGIALGAIVSPTDAVATSIVKRVGVSSRVSAVLSGESLLNDASALVLLRSAIAGSAVAVPLWHVAGEFVYAVAVAVVIGSFVGWINLRARARVTDATVNTLISFSVPFLASIPADTLGASGLVAAVVAGLVTGQGAPRHLPPQHRASDVENWRLVELVLEGAIFLLMGLELYGIVVDVRDAREGLARAVLLAMGALVLILVIRAAYVAQMLFVLGRLRRRRHRSTTRTVGERLTQLGRRTSRSGPGSVSACAAPSPQEDPDPTSRRSRRLRADIDYFEAAPLGWRNGGILVWAGMRGAVTVAAAQTLPSDAPNRSLLILVAFVVAALSLLVQGSTLARFVGWISKGAPPGSDPDNERRELIALLARVRQEIIASEPRSDVVRHLETFLDEAGSSDLAAVRKLALRIANEQRSVLLDLRDDGLFSADVVERVLRDIDAAQISIELRG